MPRTPLTLLILGWLLVSAPGCAGLQKNVIARAVVISNAHAAEEMAADAIEAQIAQLPVDPVDMTKWLMNAGLTSNDASLVVAGLEGDISQELAAAAAYIRAGALGRTVWSILSVEPAASVGRREIAYYLLGRAQARNMAPLATP